MRIGLITFHDTTNFGSLLQTYGLYKCIKDNGYDIDIIDYQCEAIIKRELIHKCPLSINPKHTIGNFILQYHHHRKLSALRQFLHTNTSLSSTCHKQDVKNVAEIYDKLVIGSDIVWGMDVIERDTSYFLDFASKGCKKTAFSSSIGNPWNATDKKTIAPLLRQFDYIAVREDESAEWVRELTGSKPDVVCDPTMLLHTQEWEKLVIPKKSHSYVLVYFDTENKDCLTTAKKYAAKRNLEVLLINYNGPKRGAKSVRPHSIEEFLSLIYNADEIITASYHGMLFSIYFNKEFVYFNRAHKSRMNTLARKLGLESQNGKKHPETCFTPINYTIVNRLVEEYRTNSTQCLRKLLEC